MDFMYQPVEPYRAIMALLLDIKWDKWFNSQSRTSPHSTNKVCNKETNGQIHGWYHNHWTKENFLQRRCQVSCLNWEAALHEVVVSCNKIFTRQQNFSLVQIKPLWCRYWSELFDTYPSNKSFWKKLGFDVVTDFEIMIIFKFFTKLQVVRHVRN